MARFLPIFLFCLWALGAQDTPPPVPRFPSTTDPRLPNGKSQKDAIAKEDHDKNLEDISELMKIAEELKINLEKNSQFVVSVADMKKTEEIEKLAKRIRSRMKRN